MSSPGSALLGSQQPRVHSVPPYVTSWGPEVIDLCALAGVNLDPWQQLVITDALGEDADGHWAAFEVGVAVPRQNGKGEIILARQLAGLLLIPDDRLIVHTAHEYKTAQEAFLRLKTVIDNNAFISKRVKAIREANGEQGVEMVNGKRLRFLARSKGSGRGFTGDCVILDEAMILQPQAIGALMPTMAARPNPQLWYLGSASLGTDESDVFDAVRERALDDIDAAA